MDSKKKKLIIILSVVGVIVLAAVIAIAVIFTREPEAPPAAKEGVIYQTEPETFWANTGSGYMTFENIPEPAEPVEGELYGQVFKVWALNDGEWQDWLSGTWEMNADKTELTLTATWDESDGNATKLRDAESGVAKIYTAEDGKFYIGVNYPGGAFGEVTFTLDPVADQVGEVTDNDGNGNVDEDKDNNDDQGEVTPPCTEHVDSNNDGKCDNCGETMPIVSTEPIVTLTATDATTTATAEIELFMDGTFNFNVYLAPYMDGKVFGGTWASTETGNFVAPVTLTPDATGAAVIGNNITVTLTPNSDYSVITYTCHVDYIVPDAISMAFDFTGSLNTGDIM